MIAKCALIALLAVVASAQSLGCEQVVMASSGSVSPASQIALVSPVSSSGTGAITRNLVARGKYPVALGNCGPTPDQQIPVTTSRVTAPLQEKPTVRLPARIPQPQVISHSCTCYKTVLRPRVHQQIVTVPTVQRYLETTHKPVVEQIQYEALPVNCQSGSSSGSAQLVTLGSGFSSGSAQLVALNSGSYSSGSVDLISAGSPVQAVQIPAPQVQVVEAPRIQAIQVPAPQVQVVEAPQVQAIQIPAPQVQVVEAPQVQAIQIPAPQVQVVEAPQVQAVEIPSVQVVEAPRVQAIEVPAPQVQVVGAPRVQAVEMPQVQSVEIPRSISF